MHSARILATVFGYLFANGWGGTLSAQCTYCAPEVSLATHHPDAVAPSAYDGRLSYTTPAYVSMDLPRSVSLVYSSHQAAPYGYLQVDVRTPGGNTPQATSIQVVDPVTSVVLSAERFYAGIPATEVARLAAQWDMSTQTTGSYPIRVIVRNYWNGGAQVQASTHDTRILIVNERSSRFGTGWSMAGVQRLHIQSSMDVVLTGGDGSGLLFRLLACHPTFCGYESPRGDFSTLTRSVSTGAFTRLFPDGSTAEFNASGLLQYVESRFGHRTTYTWTNTPQGVPVPTAVTDPAGKSITFTYYSGEYLATITTPGTSGGRSSTLGYASASPVIFQDPDGTYPLRNIQYDSSFRVYAWEDRAGFPWDVSYDYTHSIQEFQRPEISSGPIAGRPRTYFTSPRKRTLPFPGAGLSVGSPVPAVRLDSLWLSIRDATGDSTLVAPSGGFDTPARVRDVNGLIGRMWVDSLGRDTLVISPKGDTVRYTWTGRLLTRIAGGREPNHNGIMVPKWAQDLSYTTYGLLSQVSGTGQPAEYYYYGSLGQLDSMKVRGTRTRYTYGSDWRLASVVDPTGLTTTYHRSSTGWMNTDSVRSSGRRVAFTYDQYGRPQQTTNPLGQTTSTSYDALNRPTSVTDGRSYSTALAYDSVGLATVTDALSQTYQYRRNALGWVLREIDPRGQADSTDYTWIGAVRSYRNRRGQTITMTFDTKNRPVQVDSGGTALITYEYDPNGRWTRIFTPESTDTIYTDTVGRVVRETIGRGSLRWTIARGYDADQLLSNVGVKVTGMTQLLTRTSYVYDEGRLDRITFGYPDVWALLQYNSVGQVTEARFVNESSAHRDTLRYSYNNHHGLYTLRYSRAAFDVAFGLRYARDALGRIIERAGALSDSTRGFQYDAAGQLVTHADSALVPICTWNEVLQQEFCINGRDEIGSRSYSYDAVGNRTDGGAVMDSGKGNRLVSFGGYTFQYDADGNLTRKYFTASTWQFDQHLTWNILGQLVSVSTTRQGSTTTATFGYDGLGRRVRKTVGTVVTRYVHSGSDLMMETDGSGNVTATYGYYPGVDQPFAMRRGGVNYLYAREATGHISGLVTTTGQVAAEYRYTPWGEIEYETPNAVQNPLRFTGREWDAETGLYYYRARYYDPQVGRFISEDPIRLAGGINVFAYVGNDPVNRRDPSGLRPPRRLGPMVVSVPGNPCLHAVDEGHYYDAWKQQAVFCEGMGLDLEELPHHLSVANPQLARRQLYGPWPATGPQRQRVQCIQAGWLSGEAGGVLATLTIETAILGALYEGFDDSGAVFVYPRTIIFNGRDPQLDLPRGTLYMGPALLAWIIAHEIGHYHQYQRLGYEGFHRIADTRLGMDLMQADADRYADRSSSESGPMCPMEE